ncbi:MAG: GAF domain-containing sensor histidine kinase [Chloroflexi bacterium]|nr:GAF domain-containing sensor histidine kinase [Chloroflexota bacterium]
MTIRVVAPSKTTWQTEVRKAGLLDRALSAAIAQCYTLAENVSAGQRVPRGATDSVRRQGLHGLKWAGVVLPMAFLLLVNFVVHFLLPSIAHTWWGFLLLNLLLLAAVAIFSQVVFALIERVQEQLARLYEELRDRNLELARTHAASERLVEQLRALSTASATMTEDLTLEVVLQKVVDLSRELLGAQYGALLVRAERETGWFLTSGLDPAQRAAIGTLPTGRGLLGGILTGQVIRAPDVARDDRSVGFPPNHPAMRSFLGVPIMYRGQILGGLYLTNKLGVEEFSPEDQDVLTLFARHAAVAIENARLYQQAQDVAVLEERERIAREMHDNFAQVLGYVNTKTQAAVRLLALGDGPGAQEQMTKMEEAARHLYADVREAILGLRSPLGVGRPFLGVVKEYLSRFSQMSDIEINLDAAVAETMVELTPRMEIQLFRIIQEALTNVRKHAQATEARVRVEENGQGWLAVTVEDNGRGFDASRPVRDDWPHLGLQTMRERAEAVGGSFRVESNPGQGTRVTVTMPLRRAG